MLYSDAELIEDSDDLNDEKFKIKPSDNRHGNFRVASGTDITGRHFPEDFTNDGGGRLFLLSTQSGRFAQILIDGSRIPQMWIRWFDGLRWNDWVRFVGETGANSITSVVSDIRENLPKNYEEITNDVEMVGEGINGTVGNLLNLETTPSYTQRFMCLYIPPLPTSLDIAGYTGKSSFRLLRILPIRWRITHPIWHMARLIWQ